jgi:hypothetical protein
MTEWTPKLAALIEKYADCDEAQLKACLDPKRSVGSSYVYWCFKSMTIRNPTYKKICTELNLSRTAIGMETRQTLIELARENNDSVAADKLERADHVWNEMVKYAPSTIRGSFKRIKAAKKNGLKF